MSEMWNLWHGCHKKSEGCQHCYVYRRDAEFEKDSNVVTKTASFNLPIRRDRSGNWKVPSGTLMWTCFTSDFFIEEADEWRIEAWKMIRERSDCSFIMVCRSSAMSISRSSIFLNFISRSVYWSLSCLY